MNHSLVLEALGILSWVSSHMVSGEPEIAHKLHVSSLLSGISPHRPAPWVPLSCLQPGKQKS